MSCESKILEQMHPDDLSAALEYHQRRVDAPVLYGMQEPADYLIELVTYGLVRQVCTQRGVSNDPVVIDHHFSSDSTPV